MSSYVLVKHERDRIYLVLQLSPAVKELLDAAAPELQVVFKSSNKAKVLGYFEKLETGGYSFNSSMSKWQISILRGWRLEYLGRDRVGGMAEDPVLVNYARLGRR